MTTLAPRPGRTRSLAIAAALLVLVAAVAAAVVLLVRGGSDGADVSVYPSAGTLAASAGTTVTLRGTEAVATGDVRVTGAQSGEHAGRWTQHPDDRGATFTPDEPFSPGEEVTVEAGATIAGTDGERSTFAIAPAGDVPQPPFDEGKPEGDTGIQRFASRPDLRPPAVTVLADTPAATDGHVFVAPKRGPTQEGPMILDAEGETVWFSPVEGDEQVFDFRVQEYRGEPVLTWWQGGVALYRGTGTGRLMDASYQPVAEVRMANGYDMDAHEFQLTDRGTALVMSYVPVPWDLSKLGGRRDGLVEDCVIQEIDVETGALLFEWHALGSIRLDESIRPAPKKQGQFHDPYHFNSIALDENGDFVVSARHTNAVYLIDRETGDILWRLGGERSDFEMGPGTEFALQHDARPHADGTLSLFDNVAEDLPARGRQSRGLVLDLDTEAMRATVAEEFERPETLSPTQGSMQAMEGGGAFVGWGGSRREFTEFGADGAIAWDARFVTKDVESYRAYRLPWQADPTEPPRAVLRDGAVHASWNGATDVAEWRVTTPGGQATTRPRDGFETRIPVPPGTAANALTVEALDDGGTVLAGTDAG